MKKSQQPCPAWVNTLTIIRKRNFNINLKFLLSIVLLGLLPSLTNAQGFTISGNQLRDANGNNFIMKGVNVPLAWFINDVNNNIVNIRNNTRSNTLRIVVSTSTADNDWQTAVARTIANNMIPMVELHSVTGSNSPADLQRMADWWASKASYLRRADIARYILVNIANEWGDWFMASPTNPPSETVWRDAYINAVRTIRNAGVNTTLVVDAPGYGQDNKAFSLLNYADDVQAADPRHNVLFSVHMYCEWRKGGSSSISTLLPQIKNSGIPIIVGEFGFQHASDGSCDIDEQLILNTAQSNGIGWLAWSWKGNGSSVGYLDLSNDWAGTSLTGWGNTIVNGTNGTKTSATASVFGTTPPPATIANGTYRITPRHSGKSLDVAGSSTADGANVSQWTYGGGLNQRFIIQSLGGGAYSIRAQHSGKSLDVSGSSTADGANVQQWAYSGGNNQRWRIESVGSGYYRIVSVNSSKCLDVTSASTADGANVIQWTCGGGTNQNFALQLLSTATSRLEIAEVSPENGVYPNPSNGSYNISYSGDFQYAIKDKLGKVVEQGKGNNSTITRNDLPSGVYILQIKSTSGTKELKIIKE